MDFQLNSQGGQVPKVSAILAFNINRKCNDGTVNMERYMIHDQANCLKEIFDMMKKISDFTDYMNVLPYSSEIFGVYQALFTMVMKFIARIRK